MKNIKTVINNSMRKFGVYSLVIIFILSSCSFQDKDSSLNKKSKILKNHSKALTELVANADVFGMDDESGWAYSQVDSLLSTIDTSGNDYLNDLVKIYVAYSQVFYGMSYINSVMAIVMGADFTLEELTSAVIPLSTKFTNYQDLAAHELSSIQSMINFCKVGGMQDIDDVYEMLQQSLLNNAAGFKENSEELAYSIASFHNKRLYLMTMLNLVFDFYLSNHMDSSKSKIDKYMKNLIRLEREMHEIPSDKYVIKIFSEEELLDYMVKISEIQKQILHLFINELKLMK